MQVQNIKSNNYNPYMGAKQVQTKQAFGEILATAIHNRKNFIDEQRSILERYDIDNIKPNTPEDTKAMKDLRKAGIISETSPVTFLNVIYTGGNASGLSFELGYAENSGKDNPVMIARGRDENGNEFEQTIFINDISPSNATYLEMSALAAHLMQSGASSVIPQGEADNMGLNDRANFNVIFMNNFVACMQVNNRKGAADTMHYLNTIRNYVLMGSGEGAAAERAAMEAAAKKAEELGLQRVYLNVGSIFNAAVNGIAHLSDEQKAMLNEKYDIRNIRPGSPEYNALMEELKRLGVISDILPPEILKAHSIGVDEYGFITHILTRVDGPQESSNILDWFRDLLNTRGSEYSKVKGKDEFSEQAQLFEFLIDYKKNMLMTLNELFKKD